MGEIRVVSGVVVEPTLARHLAAAGPPVRATCDPELDHSVPRRVTAAIGSLRRVDGDVLRRTYALRRPQKCCGLACSFSIACNALQCDCLLWAPHVHTRVVSCSGD
jgi:hypothetical protein